MNPLPDNYVQTIHDYQDVKNNYLPDKYGYEYKSSNQTKKNVPEPIVEPTFEDLYATLEAKKKDASRNDKGLQVRYRMWEELKDMEKQIAEEEKSQQFYAEMDQKFDEHKLKITDTLKSKQNLMTEIRKLSSHILSNQKKHNDTAPLMDEVSILI